MKKIMSYSGNGASSILMIFVILCFTVLAVLSLLSARIDAKMAKKANDAALEYYEAQNYQAKRLLQLDEILVGLRNGLDWSLSPQEIDALYYDEIVEVLNLTDDFFIEDMDNVFLEVKINEYKTLCVTIRLLDAANPKRFEVIQRFVTAAPTTEEESSVSYWPGF